MIWKRLLRAFVVGLVTAFASAHARQVVDMAGRTVDLPDRIGRIYAAQPYTNVLAYVVAPDLMLGLTFSLRDSERRFLRPEARKLPVFGVEPGSGAEANIEWILAAKPDLVLLKGNASTEVSRSVERYEKFGIPTIFVDLDRIDDYPAGIEFIGKLVGRETRASRIADEVRRVLSEVDQAVASVPQNKRLRVYYAESVDGLTTECDQSFHADAIKRAGGIIVHQCLLKTHKGMEKVSIEQVILYNPDVIVSNEAGFLSMAYSDPRWKKIRAIANRNVLIVPRTPFNWIDRPPSVTRILGIRWLAQRFYPNAFRNDGRKDLSELHQLLLGVLPQKRDLDAWLKNGPL